MAQWNSSEPLQLDGQVQVQVLCGDGEIRASKSVDVRNSFRFLTWVFWLNMSAAVQAERKQDE